eukprot:3351022-Alexandrium_andersonii.AAC.1
MLGNFRKQSPRPPVGSQHDVVFGARGVHVASRHEVLGPRRGHSIRERGAFVLVLPDPRELHW